MSSLSDVAKTGKNGLSANCKGYNHKHCSGFHTRRYGTSLRCTCKCHKVKEAK